MLLDVLFLKISSFTLEKHSDACIQVQNYLSTFHNRSIRALCGPCIEQESKVKCSCNVKSGPLQENMFVIATSPPKTSAKLVSLTCEMSTKSNTVQVHEVIIT